MREDLYADGIDIEESEHQLYFIASGSIVSDDRPCLFTLGKEVSGEQTDSENPAILIEYSDQGNAGDQNSLARIRIADQKVIFEFLHDTMLCTLASFDRGPDIQAQDLTELVIHLPDDMGHQELSEMKDALRFISNDVCPLIEQ